MNPVDLPILDDLRVAAPCPARWEAMTGDDQARFCASCRKTVYDLSGLTRAEALALVTRPGETPCVRFYRRSDGTILTADCPVGLLTRANRWRRRVIAATLALVAGTSGATAALRSAAEAEDLTPSFPGFSSAPASGAAGRAVNRVTGWVDDALVYLGIRSRSVVTLGELSGSFLPPPTSAGSVTMGEPVATLGKPALPMISGGTTCLPPAP